MYFFVDKVVDKVIDAGLSSMEKMLLENKLKKILKKSMDDYISMEKIKNPNCEPQCVVDEDKIQNLEERLIMPNLSVEELECNLKEFFSECIVVDDEHKANSIRKFICCNYKASVADFITLNQIDEDIHKLNKLINTGKEEIVNKLDKTDNRIKEMSERVKSINKSLHSNAQYPICFLNELDDSKVFCYISMRVLDDIDEHFLEEVGDNVFAETNVYIDEDGFTNIDFNFLEPIIQSEMKEYIKYINDEFSQESIRIISVSTHA